MTEEIPEADRQEQEGGGKRPSLPPDAPEGDAMEQGDLTPPPTERKDELEKELERQTEERSGDEPA